MTDLIKPSRMEWGVPLGWAAGYPAWPEQLRSWLGQARAAGLTQIVALEDRVTLRSGEVKDLGVDLIALPAEDTTYRGVAFFQRRHPRSQRVYGLDLYATSAQAHPFCMLFSWDRNCAARLTWAEYQQVKARFEDQDWVWSWHPEDNGQGRMG